MELWDVYDINRKKTGKIIDRHSNERLNEGEYHLAAEAIIVSKNKILISQRANFKNNYPLLWECTGGSVKSGENSIDGILRELNEELGLQFNKEDAILYKAIRDDKSKVFKDIWLFNKNVDINNIVFRDHEVIDAKWATIDDLEEMKEKNMLTPKFKINKMEFNNILKLINQNN